MCGSWFRLITSESDSANGVLDPPFGLFPFVLIMVARRLFKVCKGIISCRRACSALEQM